MGYTTFSTSKRGHWGKKRNNENNVGGMLRAGLETKTLSNYDGT